jgi:hypothetical protein
VVAKLDSVLDDTAVDEAEDDRVRLELNEDVWPGFVPIVVDESAGDELRIAAAEDEELNVLEAAEEVLETPMVGEDELIVAEDAGVALELPAMEEESLAAREDEADLNTPAEEEVAGEELGTAVVDTA